MVEFTGKDFKKLMNNVKPLIKAFNAFGDIEVVGGAAIERFKFWIVPKELGRIEDIAMKVDKVSLDKDLSHFARDLFARKGNFPPFGKIAGELLRMINRFLDELFKCGEFN